MHQELTEYFRCPEELVTLQSGENLSDDCGSFRFGADTVCYGRTSQGFRATHVNGDLYDAANDVLWHENTAVLPFDPAEVSRNLRYESYVHSGSTKRAAWNLVRDTYYLFRPHMPVGLRKHLQKIFLKRDRKS